MIGMTAIIVVFLSLFFEKSEELGDLDKKLLLDIPVVTSHDSSTLGVEITYKIEKENISHQNIRKEGKEILWDWNNGKYRVVIKGKKEREKEILSSEKIGINTIIRGEGIVKILLPSFLSSLDMVDGDLDVEIINVKENKKIKIPSRYFVEAVENSDGEETTLKLELSFSPKPSFHIEMREKTILPLP